MSNINYPTLPRYPSHSESQTRNASQPTNTKDDTQTVYTGYPSHAEAQTGDASQLTNPSETVYTGYPSHAEAQTGDASQPINPTKYDTQQTNTIEDDTQNLLDT